MMRRLMMSTAVAFCCMLPLAGYTTPVLAQERVTAFDQTFALQEAIRKMNAYVVLANGSLRANDAWERYRSWVNLTTGPTGRERIVYGIYSVDALSDEIAAVRQAAKQTPRLPALEQAGERFIEAYSAFVKPVTDAQIYYERKDYLTDGHAGAKALHARLMPAATAYLAARQAMEAELATVTAELDRIELASIEKRDGKKARWHVRKLMIDARVLAATFPSDQRPRVDLPALDAAAKQFAETQGALDTLARNEPALAALAGRSRSFVATTRTFQAAVAKARGDSRQAATEANDMFNEYNVVVDVANATNQSLR